MTNISTLANHLRLQHTMRQTKAELNRMSKEVASGTHADYFAGLSGQATRGMALRTAFSQIGFYQESGNLAATQLKGQQEAIDRVATLAEDIRGKLLSVQNGADNFSPRTISDGAENALEQLRGILNFSLGGRFVFSGPATNVPPMRDPSDGPEAAIAALKVEAGGDLRDSAGMQDFLGRLDQVFANTHPTYRYNTSFYAGSDPATSGELLATIDRDQQVSLDVRATEDAFKLVAESFYALAFVPEPETTTESFRTMAVNLTEKLTQGLGKLNDLAAVVGYRQQQIADARTRHDNTTAIVNNAISDLESIDEYQAASRLTLLEQQMQITYSLTARLNNLSLANFL